MQGYGDLGEAIGGNYSIQGPDIVGSLTRGYQMEQMARAKEEAARLKREQEKARQDAAYAKIADSISFKDVHPYLLPKVKDETVKKIKEANDLYVADPVKNFMKSKEILGEARRSVEAAVEQSPVIDQYMKAPANELTNASLAQRSRLAEAGDVRAVEGQVDPVTGEGIKQSRPIYSLNKFAKIGDEWDKRFTDAAKNRIEQSKLNKDTRLITQGYTNEDAAAIGDQMWNDPLVKASYLNANHDKIVDKYGRSHDITKGYLRDHPDVNREMKDQFIKVTGRLRTRFDVPPFWFPKSSEMSVSEPFGG